MEDEVEKCENLVDQKPLETTKKKKKHKEPGVIYLSKIPALMNVKKIRDIFEQYGEIGKIFLQPNDKASNTKRGRLFTEGWVEFLNKTIAKQVAATLNNTLIGGKKRSRWHDEIWNIKYLHRFKWAHLNERLAYEKAVHKQRLHTEIAQVKRMANFHIQNAEKRNKLKAIEERKRKQGKGIDNDNSDNEYQITQRDTEEVLLTKKRNLDLMGDNSQKGRKKRKKEGLNKKSFLARTSLLQNIFSGGIDEET